MKQLAVLAGVLLILIACGEDKKNPVSGTMINVYERGKQAGEQANLDAVRKTVQAYHAANDRYPQSLDEIKGMIGKEMDLSRYDYNPQTGEVNLKSN